MKPWIAVFWIFACDPSPAELPPPARTQAAAVGSRVRVGDVYGFLARPAAREGLIPCVVLLVDVVDDDAQRQALAIAEDQRLGFAIPPEVGVDDAILYVHGMTAAAQGPVDLRCVRAQCP